LGHVLVDVINDPLAPQLEPDTNRNELWIMEMIEVGVLG
jgi:hypothetical protein